MTRTPRPERDEQWWETFDELVADGWSNAAAVQYANDEQDEVEAQWLADVANDPPELKRTGSGGWL